MLMYDHKNILHSMNLANVANGFVDSKDSNKHSEIFVRIIHNMCKIQLTHRHFSYIYISYQMYICVKFYPSFYRFPQANSNRISIS